MHYALDHLTGPVLKKLTHDTLFHNVMTNSREALTGFLAAVLHVRPEEITDITFLDTVDYYKRVSSKKIGLDIKLELNHTTVVNIEVQAYHQENWDKRELFYTGRMMAAQKADSQYSNVLPVIHIGILEKDSSDDFLFLDQYNPGILIHSRPWAHMSSTSATVLGMGRPRTRLPSSVMSRSSSMRMPPKSL